MNVMNGLRAKSTKKNILNWCFENVFFLRVLSDFVRDNIDLVENVQKKRSEYPPLSFRLRRTGKKNKV
jgi:hypothetical protein